MSPTIQIMNPPFAFDMLFSFLIAARDGIEPPTSRLTDDDVVSGVQITP